MKITKKHFLLTSILTSTVILAQSALASNQVRIEKKPGSKTEFTIVDSSTPTTPITVNGINEISREIIRLKKAGKSLEPGYEKKLLKGVADDIDDFAEDLQGLKVGGDTLLQLKNNNADKTTRDAKIDAVPEGAADRVFGDFLAQRAADDEALESLVDKFDLRGSLAKRKTSATEKSSLTTIEGIEGAGEFSARQKTSDLPADGTNKRLRKAEYEKLVDINEISGPNRKVKHNLLRDELDAIRADINSTDATKKAAAEARLKTLQDNVNLLAVKDPENKTVADLPDFQRPDRDSSAALENNHSAITNIVDARISETSGGSDVASAGDGGIAAGEIFATYGAWVKGTVSNSTQKAYGYVTGYTSDQKGVTIGFDTGDESMVGISYSFFNNKVKNKTDNTKKDDITSHTGTLYGKYLVSDEVFLNGQLQYGMSEIKKTRVDATNGTLSAKPKARSMGGKIEVGYNYPVPSGYKSYGYASNFSDFYITPTIGISHFDSEVKGYTESGPAGSPLPAVSKNTSKRTSLIGRVSSEYAIKTESVVVMPEAHIDMDYALNTKDSGTGVTVVDGLAPIVTPTEKATKFRYGAGISLKLKSPSSDMYEISAGYDIGLAKKFMSHTGFLKLRVNF